MSDRSVGDHAERWEQARSDIAAGYGFDLAPQIGFVPVGTDPISGLWEFWHVLSGDEPRRDANGDLVLEDGTGLVFVLVPALEGLVGAQRRDPNQANYDPAARDGEVPAAFDLGPFLVSKYELTQAQWLRITGRLPSYVFAGSHWQGLGAVSGLHPVENISWREATAALAEVGLQLPTEAQWELAARAGADTPLHFGEGLSGEHRANLLGSGDGYVVHGPVHVERPNALGLHGVIGNVRELCKDVWSDRLDRFPHDPTTGEIQARAFRRRSVRGASYARPASEARVAFRMNIEPDLRSEDIGVRPVRCLPRVP